MKPPLPPLFSTPPLYIIITKAPTAAAITIPSPLLPFLAAAPVKGLAPVNCTFAASVEVALLEEAVEAVIVENSDATDAVTEEVGGAATEAEVARVVLATSEVVLIATGVLLVAGKAALLLETDGAA